MVQMTTRRAVMITFYVAGLCVFAFALYDQLKRGD